MPRFKSINFYQNRFKIVIFAKNTKFSRAGGFVSRPPKQPLFIDFWLRAYAAFCQANRSLDTFFKQKTLYVCFKPTLKPKMHPVLSIRLLHKSCFEWKHWQNFSSKVLIKAISFIFLSNAFFLAKPLHTRLPL